MSRACILIFGLLFFPFCAIAEDSAGEDPIDQAMEAAIEKDSSTAGMVQATIDAKSQWDKKMNALYQTLKSKMAADEWSALVAAQKAWLNFRDLQFKSIEDTYSKMEGTMWRPVAASEKMEIVKDRALFLNSLLGTINER